MAKAAAAEQLILEALERALVDPQPRKLHGTRANPGIFLSTSTEAKAAAAQCVAQQLLAPRGELKGRGKPVPLFGITPAAIVFLLERDPVQRVLAATQEGINHLARRSSDCQQTLAGVQSQLAQLQQVLAAATARLQIPDIAQLLAAVQAAPAASRGSDPATGAAELPAGQLRRELLECLRRQKTKHPLQPLELPQLLRLVRQRHEGTTLGQFHDLLRQMAAAREIRLSPFTQAMYQLPEPDCALMMGREVMYYAELG